MCAVIDPPLFIPIVNSNDQRHADFGILKDWLTTGIGKAVMGGAQYRQELSRVSSVLPFIGELERRGKVVKVDAKKVDEAADFATATAKSADFDDAHLVALVAVSGCRVVCLNDPRAHQFLKDPALYNPRRNLPKLFTGARNQALLTKKYDASCCR